VVNLGIWLPDVLTRERKGDAGMHVVNVPYLPFLVSFKHANSFC
jgi:hypothetical protein